MPIISLVIKQPIVSLRSIRIFLHYIRHRLKVNVEMDPDNSSNSSRKSGSPPERHTAQFIPSFFEFSTNTVDLTQSIAQLGKNIFREYRSDFVLPCQTHVAITRQESSYPAEQIKSVSIDLSVGFTELSLRYDPEICRRLEQHLEDDIWAEIMAQYAQSNDKELLRQLEEGCRSQPELYVINRVERQRNKRIIMNLNPKPVVRIIGVTRRDSTDTSMTEVTELNDVEWCPDDSDLPDQINGLTDLPEEDL